MSTHVAVVGSSVIDFITYTHRQPQLGETILGQKFQQGFGGKGANQCVAAARLGAKTAFVTSLGSDSMGRDYFKNLRAENIDVEHVKFKNDVSTGIAQIVVTDTGENTIVIVPGANAQLSDQDVAEARDKISSASVLLCQFETPLDATLEALKIFEKYGKGVSIVNGAPAIKDISPEIFRLAHIFCVNETEAEIMTDTKSLTLSNAQEAVDKFFSLGCNTVIITFGAQGAVLATKSDKNVIHIPAVTVEAVDTTGAGDAFLGALAYFIDSHPNMPMEECIKRSNKIASQSVLKAGTQTSFPHKKELPLELFLD